MWKRTCVFYRRPFVLPGSHPSCVVNFCYVSPIRPFMVFEKEFMLGKLFLKQGKEQGKKGKNRMEREARKGNTEDRKRKERKGTERKGTTI